MVIILNLKSAIIVFIKMQTISFGNTIDIVSIYLKVDASYKRNRILRC